MGYYDLDLRTRLLLTSRVHNGVKITVEDAEEQEVMNQMVEEGLFSYSDTRFSEGYWSTPEGDAAAETAWEKVPTVQFETSYRDHPQVEIDVNGNKEELCHVTCASRPQLQLWVRESMGQYLVDHPSGEKNECFKSADEAIEWALTA